MNLDMSVVFINLLELFLLIGVGALCGRARIFPEETPKVFSILLTRITLPCTLFCLACRQILRPGVCRGYGYGLERPGEKPGSGFLMIQS